MSSQVCFYGFMHSLFVLGNMAIGLNNPKQIYLFDFGLARRFVQRDPETNEICMREERQKAPFRGTYHYCSLKQHSNDACRRDDLW